MSTAAAPLDERHFEGLYVQSTDPWGFRTRWYERRKRALTLAALPHEHYASAFEAGCANGELAADLAPRCSQLLACDFHEHALRIASERVACLQQVKIEQRQLPEQWPQQRFDLIVISELAYYLTHAQLAGLLKKARDSLTPQGVLLACHWRHPIADALSDGDTVHEAFAQLQLPRLLHHLERDFVLEVWSRDARSVAQREGLA
jgi:SAM-dependent methyltransferase